MQSSHYALCGFGDPSSALAHASHLLLFVRSSVYIINMVIQRLLLHPCCHALDQT